MSSVTSSSSVPQPFTASTSMASPTASSPTTTVTTAQASTASPTQQSVTSSVSSPHFPTPSVGAPPHPFLPHHAAVASAAFPGSSVRSTSINTAPLQPRLPSASSERQIAEARAAVVASIGNMFDREVQPRAAMLHTNEAAIRQQQADLERATAALRAENEKLRKVAADAARKIKEVGDVQNFAEVMEREFMVLEETMRLVREGSSDGSERSWTGSERSWSGGGSRSRSRSRSASRAASEPGDVRDAEGDVAMGDGYVGGRGGEEVLGKGKGKEMDTTVERMDTESSQPAPTQEKPLPAAAESARNELSTDAHEESVDKGKGQDEDSAIDPMAVEASHLVPAEENVSSRVPVTASTELSADSSGNLDKGKPKEEDITLDSMDVEKSHPAPAQESHPHSVPATTSAESLEDKVDEMQAVKTDTHDSVNQE